MTGYLIRTDELANQKTAAEKAGFNNYSYFYKAFKSVYGISPAEYKSKKPFK